MPITETIRERRLRLACRQANVTVLWQPNHGYVERSRSAITLVNTLLNKIKHNSTAYLHKQINDRNVWKLIYGSRSSRTDRKYR